MITRAMIKVEEIPADGLPFTNMRRFRAGATFFAEQLMAKGAPDEVANLIKERLKLTVWNQFYAELWIKIQRMEVLVAQRRWAELETMQKELDAMIRGSFEQKEMTDWDASTKE